MGFVIPFYKRGNGGSESLIFLGSKYLLRVLGAMLSAGDRVVNEINTVLPLGSLHLASKCSKAKTRAFIGLILKLALNPTYNSS